MTTETARDALAVMGMVLALITVTWSVRALIATQKRKRELRRGSNGKVTL
jgi:hypothetical protein